MDTSTIETAKTNIDEIVAQLPGLLENLGENLLKVDDENIKDKVSEILNNYKTQLETEAINQIEEAIKVAESVG